MANAKIFIRKRIIGYAYPKNGNLANPTPRVRWEVVDTGKIIDSSASLRQLQKDHPGVKVDKSALISVKT